MPYNETDKKNRFVLPFGELNANSGSGKLIRYRTDAVVTDLVVTMQLAISMGVLNSIVKVAYDGIVIDAAKYALHKGTPGEVAADAFFPDDVNHWVNTADNTSKAAAFLNVELLPAIASEGQPDKLVVRAKCLEVEDYTSAGVVSGFGFSTNPARAAAYTAKEITGNSDLFE